LDSPKLAEVGLEEGLAAGGGALAGVGLGVLGAKFKGGRQAARVAKLLKPAGPHVTIGAKARGQWASELPKLDPASQKAIMENPLVAQGGMAPEMALMHIRDSMKPGEKIVDFLAKQRTPQVTSKIGSVLPSFFDELTKIAKESSSTSYDPVEPGGAIRSVSRGVGTMGGTLAGLGAGHLLSVGRTNRRLAVPIVAGTTLAGGAAGNILGDLAGAKVEEVRAAEKQAMFPTSPTPMGSTAMGAQSRLLRSQKVGTPAAPKPPKPKGMPKVGFATSGFSGPLSMGSFPQASGQAARVNPPTHIMDPNLKTAGPPSERKSKVAAALTPASQLAKSQRKGQVKTTGFSGPSIAEIAKPDWAGKVLPGAGKNRI